MEDMQRRIARGDIGLEKIEAIKVSDVGQGDKKLIG